MKKGFSEKINDSAFERYKKNSNKYSLFFALSLCLISVLSFYFYGENSSEMDNPQAIYIGVFIGAIFIFIALIQILQRLKSKTWDGKVIDKKIEHKQQKKYSSGNGFFKQKYIENKIEYIIIIKRDDGKNHTIITENDDTLFNYYKIGDLVRHHKGLNTLEKYDKTEDKIIFCNACASLNDINDDFCHRCGAPLLK